jgi:hypothetical protein
MPINFGCLQNVWKHLLIEFRNKCMWLKKYENIKKFSIVIENAAIQDPVLRRAKLWAFQDREEQYDTAMWKHAYILQKLDEMGITDPSERGYYQEWVKWT